MLNFDIDEKERILSDFYEQKWRDYVMRHRRWLKSRRGRGQGVAVQAVKAEAIIFG